MQRHLKYGERSETITVSNHLKNVISTKSVLPARMNCKFLELFCAATTFRTKMAPTKNTWGPPCQIKVPESFARLMSKVAGKLATDQLYEIPCHCSGSCQSPPSRRCGSFLNNNCSIEKIVSWQAIRIDHTKGSCMFSRKCSAILAGTRPAKDVC